MAERYEIKVETGAVNVPVKDEEGNELGKIKINPSDMNIVTRYEKVVEDLNGTEFGEERELTTEELIKFSDTIKEKFDYLLDYPVSEVLFSKCNPLTVISNGDFFFENVLIAVASLIEKITNQRVEKKLKKIKKVTSKYEKKYHN